VDDQGGAAVEDGALVDVSLVGDLAGVRDGGSSSSSRRSTLREEPFPRLSRSRAPAKASRTVG
jgi:hypothetical protein